MQASKVILSSLLGVRWEKCPSARLFSGRLTRTILFLYFWFILFCPYWITATSNFLVTHRFRKFLKNQLIFVPSRSSSLGEKKKITFPWTSMVSIHPLVSLSLHCFIYQFKYSSFPNGIWYCLHDSMCPVTKNCNHSFSSLVTKFLTEG